MKKLISLLISVSMLVSSIITYGQTEITENFELLQALNIVEGYEDGSLKLENNITRDEATKVIVAMVNKNADANAAKGKTQFPDATEWASGYINVAAANDIINGFEDGTFRPKENITYAQIIKMIMCALGYKDYAESLSEKGANWYTSYIKLADEINITKGVYCNPTDSVTRGEVFTLIDNAINAPIIKTIGISYTDSGKLVPQIQIQDGKNFTSYKSLLTENFDIYLVEGNIIKTNKSADSLLESNEINFKVETNRTKPYDKIIDSETVIEILDLTVVDYINTYATAAIHIDDEDNCTMIAFIPSDKKNHSVTIDPKLIDVVATKATGVTELYAFANENSTKATKYKLSDSVNLYVNGYIVDQKDFDKYVFNNNSEIKLIDTYKTDGYYDSIYVNYYATAQVSSIASANKIYFKDCTETTSNITLDKDSNENLVYNIYYNNREIQIEDLREDDILSISWNVNTDINNSNEYNIYVSRKVVNGKLTNKNNEDKEVTVAGEIYSFVGAYPTNTEMPLGNEYSLYLDTFGNIYKYDTNILSLKYAVVDKITWSPSEEAYKVTMVTTNGVTKIYSIDESKINNIEDKIKSVYNTPTLNGYWTGLGSDKKHIKDRVVEYKVSSASNEITTLEFLTAKTWYDENNKYAYNINNTNIGTVKMGEATKIYDAIKYHSDNYSKYSDLTMTTLDTLIDENPYAAYAYGNKMSDGTYPLVIITAGESAYNTSTRFAVVSGSVSSSIDENLDEEIYTLPVFYKGEEIMLNISNEVDNIENLSKGDVIVFLTNSNNLVNRIDMVMKKTSYENLIATLQQSNTDFSTDLIEINNDYSDNAFSNDFTNDLNSNNIDAIKFIFGPIVEKNGKYFSIGKVDNEGKTNLISDIIEIDIDNNSTVYTYDFNKTDKLALELSAPAGIVKTNFISKYIVDDVVDWNLTDNTLDGADKKPNDDQVNFALTLVIGGKAIDTLVYLSK